MPEPSKIVIEGQNPVDLNRPPESTTQGAQEETMEQYAARREAEMRGEKPQPKPAAVTTEEQSAAATEKPAAATTETKEGDKTTPAPATEEDEKPETLIDEAHPAKKGIEKKFSKLTSARDKALAEAKAKADEAEAARKEAQEAKAEVERLKAEAAKAAETPPPVVPKPEDDPLPTRDKFDDPDEYQMALTAHAARQEIRKANEAAAAQARTQKEAEEKAAKERHQAKVQEQITALHKNFNERVEKAQGEYPDYKQKVTENEALVLRNEIFFTIEQSELAPHILYHLASNPTEAEALNTMPPIQAAMRIGELQAELRLARKPKPSNAKPPITPVRHGASPERKSPDEESMEEYAARREREETEKRAQRRRAH